MPSGTQSGTDAEIEQHKKDHVMQSKPAAWNKSFFHYDLRADIGRALKAHYDQQLEEDHQVGEKVLAQRLAVLLGKIDEFEDRERAPRNERMK
jgi:hypothetical protein